FPEVDGWRQHAPDRSVAPPRVVGRERIDDDVEIVIRGGRARAAGQQGAVKHDRRDAVLVPRAHVRHESIADGALMAQPAGDERARIDAVAGHLRSYLNFSIRSRTWRSRVLPRSPTAATVSRSGTNSRLATRCTASGVIASIRAILVS